MPIKSFDELSANNQLRIFEVSVFLRVAKGSVNPYKEAETELSQLEKTPQEWRRFRGDLFEKANAVRERLGLGRLGA